MVGASGRRPPGKKTFELIGIKERTRMMGGKYEIKVFRKRNYRRSYHANAPCVVSS